MSQQKPLPDRSSPAPRRSKREVVPGKRAQADGLELRSSDVGALPLLQHFVERMQLRRILSEHLPSDDSRTELPTVTALLVLFANLLMARGLARQREIAIRIAIGAGRTRIVRQLLTESCLLAVLGGLCGYVLTVAAWRILPAIAPINIPRLATARADWSILAFALVVALINGALFGMAPAFRAVRGRVTAHHFGAQGSAGSSLCQPLFPRASRLREGSTNPIIA